MIPMRGAGRDRQMRDEAEEIRHTVHIEKVSQLKVGDCIEWAKRSATFEPVKDGEGVVLDKRGRNILVDLYGNRDWLYFSDMAWVRKILPA